MEVLGFHLKLRVQSLGFRVRSARLWGSGFDGPRNSV